MTRLRFETDDGAAVDVEVSRLVIAGWTGRDVAAIERHIDELVHLGVTRPSAVPLFYRVAQQMLTQAAEIEVLGDKSSGEAEPVLVRAGGQWWLTVGSDHTDRRVEAYSVAVSKQMCAKPIATRAWRWDEVAAGADEIALHSEVFEDGRWVSYQEGRVAAIRPLMDLVALFGGQHPVEDGLVLYCGTLPVLPKADGTAIRPTPQFRVALVDAARQRRIVHDYRVTTLPVVA